MNKYDLGVKCTAVVASCETPEHLAVAGRYLKLASKNGAPILESRMDLIRLATAMLPELSDLINETLRKARQVKLDRLNRNNPRMPPRKV